MSSHDATRRAFLVRAVAGAGVVAGTALTPDGLAQAQEAASHEALHAGEAQTHPTAAQHRTFFNLQEAATVGAFVERIMPGAPGTPGATDADVLNYIDLALSGAYGYLQDFYRRGLAQLEAYCRERYQAAFFRLGAEQQDEVITALEQGTATGFTWPASTVFFNTIRTHTMEGMFGDPVYGGNKDFAGWRLVGFPGLQPAYSEEDLGSAGAFTRLPIVGMQQEAVDPSRKG